MICELSGIPDNHDRYADIAGGDKCGNPGQRSKAAHLTSEQPNLDAQGDRRGSKAGTISGTNSGTTIPHTRIMTTPSHAPTDASGNNSELHGVRTDSLPWRHVIPLLVTIPQAATMLAIGRSSIYELIWKGDLTPVHIGRSVRISVEQLGRFARSAQT